MRIVKASKKVKKNNLLGVVATIRKSETERATVDIVVEISEYNDELRVDVREYLYSDRYEGATKKGVNMTREVFVEVYKALTEAKEKLIEAGELDEKDFE